VQFKYKLVAAFTILILVIGVAFTIQWALKNIVFNTEPAGNYNLNETFTSQSFIYGPQGWVPYNSKLPAQPGGNIDSDKYYVMFVDLNATSNLNSTFPCVRVDYAFSGLQGLAAFHVYGYIQSNGGISWRNRIDGIGASGWYVIGNAAGGTPTQPAGAQPMQDNNHIYVKVSNKKGAIHNDFANGTYYLKFEKAGGGLNSVHITADPKNPSGEVTNTGNQTGTFYVDFTGDRVQEDFILLVAVNRTLTNSFQLNLKTSVP
jgi:hypothetical protein